MIARVWIGRFSVRTQCGLFVVGFGDRQPSSCPIDIFRLVVSALEADAPSWSTTPKGPSKRSRLPDKLNGARHRNYLPASQTAAAAVGL